MEEKTVTPFLENVVAVNIGLNQFAKSLEEQGVDVVQVNWTPPAGGDQEMMDLLDDLL
jgi:FdrA protein